MEQIGDLRFLSILIITRSSCIPQVGSSMQKLMCKVMRVGGMGGIGGMSRMGGMGGGFGGDMDDIHECNN